MTSSSDVRWNHRNKMNMICRLTNMSQNVTLNSSDSGEEVENIIWFLKGGTATALWNIVANYDEVDGVYEQENG